MGSGIGGFSLCTILSRILFLSPLLYWPLNRRAIAADKMWLTLSGKWSINNIINAFNISDASRITRAGSLCSTTFVWF